MTNKNKDVPTLTFWKSRLDESKLGCYVYGIGDPRRDNHLFYVGKGGGKKRQGNNRPDAHLNEAFDDRKTRYVKGYSDSKLQTINEIWDSGNAPTLCVIRRNLTEEAAFDVEAAVMDTLGVLYREKLTNKQGGHQKADRSIITEDSFEVIFAEPVAPASEIKSVFVFNIRNTVGERSLYDAVRASWPIGKSKCVIPAYGVGLVNGISRVVVKIESWHPGISTPKKKSFQGQELDEVSAVGSELLGKDFSRLMKNPKTGKTLGYFQRGGVICIDFMGKKKAIITRGSREGGVMDL